MTDSLKIVPANRAACEDLQTVFGARGSVAICQCQRFKLAPRELHVGSQWFFADAGFTEVSRPSSAGS